MIKTRPTLRYEPTLSALLVLVAITMTAFGDGALPVAYLVRPLGTAVLLALAIGLVSATAGRHATLVAAFLAATLAVPGWWCVLTAAIAVLIWHVHRMRLRVVPATERGTLVVTGTLCVVSVVSMVNLVQLDSPSPAPSTVSTPGPPIYLVLLDGYPRLDTLTDLGIDILPFIHDLEERGFDNYPDSFSSHTWTDLTLTAMLANRDLPNRLGSIAEKRERRKLWSVPSDFVVIAPPAGHVVIPGAREIGAGGMNDFEAHLLGRSLIGAWVGPIVIDGLRSRIEDALMTLGSTNERSVFAHLLAPHPPFLWTGNGVPACWPDCNIFANAIETLGIDRAEWIGGMRDNLTHLNAGLLTAIDAILLQHDDAVIVLFSDHGGRYSYEDPDEWHRSFLAARTPNHPRLFADAPKPDQTLRGVLDAYR